MPESILTSLLKMIKKQGQRQGTLWLAPLVDDPAAMLPSLSSATIEMVSWLFLLTLVTKSGPTSLPVPTLTNRHKLRHQHKQLGVS